MTWSCGARGAPVVLRRTNVKMVAGTLTTFSTQVTSLMNMKPVLTRRKFCKYRGDLHAACRVTKHDFTLYSPLFEDCYSHLLFNEPLLFLRDPHQQYNRFSPLLRRS